MARAFSSPTRPGTDPLEVSPSESPPGSQKPEPKSTLGQSMRSEEHTSELQSPCNLVSRFLLLNKEESNVVFVVQGVQTGAEMVAGSFCNPGVLGTWKLAYDFLAIPLMRLLSSIM